MANTIITPQIIAREALMILRNNAVMANLVYRDYSDEFVAGVGDNISVRKPAKFEAKEFTSNINVQDVTESKIDVKMDKHLDVSFAVTSKELSLSIEDFSKQLIVPAMNAFADKVDTYLLDLEQDITNRIDHTTGAVTKDDLVDLRKFLTDGAAPMADRRFVMSSDVEADLLKTDLFVNAAAVGDNGTALREASLGRKYGLDCYTDQNTANVAQKATYVPSIAFHKNAFALVTRPLALPQGAANAAIMSYDGFGLRVVYAYDATTKKDTVSIDMLCGVKTLDKNLAAVITDKRGIA